jgi:hypothetical protein
MIGTAIRCEAFWASAPTPHPSAGNAPRVVRRQTRAAVRGRPALKDQWMRLALAWALAFALCLTTIVSGAAAHETIELGAAPAAVEALKITEAPSKQEAPKKLLFAMVCTGHCAAHAFAMPSTAAAPVLVPVVRAGWPVLDDQWAQVTRPSRLERPPRA